MAALQALLEQQTAALGAGDLTALQAVHSRLQSLLAHPAWQRDAALCANPETLRAGLRAMAINADLAARGQAQAARGLAAIGAAPAVYGDTSTHKASSSGNRPGSGRAHHLTA